MMSFIFTVMVWVQVESIPTTAHSFKVYWGNSPGATTHQIIVPREQVGADKKIKFDIDTLSATRYVTVSAVNNFGEGARSNEVPTGLPVALVIKDAGV